MRPGARQQAAIEILSTLENQRRPAADAVKDWMLSHRFAGSKDRAEIGDLVFGALRWKQSSAWRMGEDTPGAGVWGALGWGFSPSISYSRAPPDTRSGHQGFLFCKRRPAPAEMTIFLGLTIAVAGYRIEPIALPQVIQGLARSLWKSVRDNIGLNLKNRNQLTRPSRRTESASHYRMCGITWSVT